LDADPKNVPLQCAPNKLLRRDLTGSHRIRSVPASNLNSEQMTKKSYYIELAFTSKQAHMRWQAVVEVPNAFVLRKQTELVNKDRREKAVALDLAREVALAAFSGAKRIVGPYHEDALWYDDRPSLLDERACDHEENGIRVWRIS
jgi:hypothetical protein